MSLTVISRPQGQILSTTAVTATVTNSSGSALFTKTTHGLIDGDFIFIKSDIGDYNGFWYVDIQDANTFLVRRYATASAQSYIVPGSVTYYESVTQHGWNAVHLPILYKLSSTLWPTNTEDTARTVSSITNDAGYVNLNLSGDIKSTGSANELEFVQVFGQNAGIYQILSWFSDSDVTIDFPYSAGVSFSASTVQYYYNNYHALIKISAGLKSDHFFASQKAYEEIATLKIVPDSNGIITVNIAEVLKAQLEVISNNLLQSTWPNDIDSFCEFFISHAEQYDDSNGYTLGTNAISYTSDQANFQGIAVNSKLAFKNRYSGFMSEYLYGGTSDTRLKFLTPMVTPQAYGQYFEIAFLNQFGNSIQMKREYYLNGVLQSTSTDALADYDYGVYRYNLSVLGGDRVDLTLLSNGYSGLETISETKTITIDQTCISTDYIDLMWLNHLGGVDCWRFRANRDFGVEIEGAEEFEKNIFSGWPESFNEFSDTIRSETSRHSRQSITVRAENLTEAQVVDLFRIKISPLVQIVNSRQARHTVLPDRDSFVYLPEGGGKLFEMSFILRLTDEFPAQSL